jgi:hypothetical protein
LEVCRRQYEVIDFMKRPAIFLFLLSLAVTAGAGAATEVCSIGGVQDHPGTWILVNLTCASGPYDLQASDLLRAGPDQKTARERLVLALAAASSAGGSPLQITTEGDVSDADPGYTVFVSDIGAGTQSFHFWVNAQPVLRKL